MVQIKTKLLDISKLPNSPYRAEAVKWNRGAAELAHNMQLDWADKACDKHPDQENTITLTVLVDGRICPELDFCCRRFEKQFNLVGPVVALEPPPVRRSLLALRRIGHHQVTRS